MSRTVIGCCDQSSPKERGHYSTTVADTTPFVVDINCDTIDRLSIQFVFAAITAVITVLESDSYIPNKSSDSGAAIRAGTFTGVSSRYTIPTMGGSAGDGNLVIDPVPYGWVRIVVTPSAGTGALNLYVTAKSLAK